jgi:hypothetical protein
MFARGVDAEGEWLKLMHYPQAAAGAAGAAAADDANDKMPRVFRRARPPFLRDYVTQAAKIEIRHWTSAIVDSVGPTHSIPPIASLFDDQVLLYAMHYIGATDPATPPRLTWLHQMNVSPRGQLLVFLANVLYSERFRESAMIECIQQMERTDFLYAWMTLHVVRLHQATRVCLVSESMAMRQYRAIARRARISPGQVPPMTFTHVEFCHLLGCGKPCSYYVPSEDPWHYNSGPTCFVLELGECVCTRRTERELHSPVARRTRDSDIVQVAGQYNTALVAAQLASGDAAAAVASANLSALHHELAVSQSKNVRVVVDMFMDRQCNIAPVRRYSIMGAVVHRARLKARESAQSFTACTLCGSATLYSVCRYDTNGMSCGRCDLNERMLRAGTKCTGCNSVLPAQSLPPLLGEPEARKRAERSERNQPKGSTGDGSAPSSARKTARQRKNAAVAAAANAEAAAAALAASPTPQPPSVVDAQVDKSDILDDSLNTGAKRTGAGSKRRTPSSLDAPKRRAASSASRRPANDPAALSPTGDASTYRTVDTMRSRLYYDDRPAVGTHALRHFSFCVECDERIPSSVHIVSVSEALRCIHKPARSAMSGLISAVGK